MCYDVEVRRLKDGTRHRKRLVAKILSRWKHTTLLSTKHSNASNLASTRKCAYKDTFKSYCLCQSFISVAKPRSTQLSQLILHSMRPASSSAPLSRKLILRLNPNRSFSSTRLLQKKKGRAEREREEEAAEKSPHIVEDPFDFSTLEAGIEKSLEKLKNDLLKLRTGGRFNPEILENVRVHLSKEGKATERLGDLAQVLPKGGRSLMVLVGETEVSDLL